VNDGINADDFPTSMSSTTRWLEILDTAGKNCSIAKVDWAAAYKHIAVRPEDIPLQYFSWLGKDFTELMLVFGGASSAGLYDRLAKTALGPYTEMEQVSLTHGDPVPRRCLRRGGTRLPVTRTVP
jgi:hypothetical protein